MTNSSASPGPARARPVRRATASSATHRVIGVGHVQRLRPAPDAAAAMQSSPQVRRASASSSRRICPRCCSRVTCAASLRLRRLVRGSMQQRRAFRFGCRSGVGQDAVAVRRQGLAMHPPPVRHLPALVVAPPRLRPAVSPAASLRSAMMAATGRNRKRRSSQSRTRTLTVCRINVVQSSRISARTDWRTAAAAR